MPYKPRIKRVPRGAGFFWSCTGPYAPRKFPSDDEIDLYTQALKFCYRLNKAAALARGLHTH